MERWHGKVAVVTGASSGIGKAIVENLLRNGIKVAGFARRVEKVEKVASEVFCRNGFLYPIKCDVTKENEIIQAFETVKQKLGPIQILINNAGIARPTTLIDGDVGEWRKVIDTNFLALCICTKEAIKSMEEHNVPGHIIHINSICGHYVPSLLMNNVYPGTKFAVTALVETLRKELNIRKSKIKISSVSPGLVGTEIAEANGFFKYEEVKDVFSKAPKLKSEDIADAVSYILGTPPHVMIQELTIRPVGEDL